MALIIHLRFQTQGGKESHITLEESRHKRKLHSLNSYSGILCWILLFKFDNVLSHASSIYLQFIYIYTPYSPYIFTPLRTSQKSISKSPKPAKQDCLHFLNLFLTKYSSNLLLQVWGFCLPGFNKTWFHLLMLFPTADNTANLLHENKCF